MQSPTSIRTFYIPHYAAINGMPNPPPHTLFNILPMYGLGEILRVDIAPRNVQTESADWMGNGLAENTDFMAFVHVDTTNADSDVISLIDDLVTSFQLDWGEAAIIDGCEDLGSGYWIVLPSTSSGRLTHASATFHPIEPEQTYGIVSLRRQNDDQSALIDHRCLLTSPYTAGSRAVLPSWVDNGVYRYDMFNGEHNLFHPYADSVGRVAYTESEFVAAYGHDLGQDRFRDAPHAAILQFAMPPRTVHITTTISGVYELSYYDIYLLDELATPILNALIGIALSCPGLVSPPQATTSIVMDPPRGWQRMDRELEDGTVIFDVHVIIDDCSSITYQALNHNVRLLNNLIGLYSQTEDHIMLDIVTDTVSS